MTAPPRVNVVGAEISVCNAERAMSVIANQLQWGGGGYVCFTNAHTAVLCRQDKVFRSITNSSLLSLADGKSVSWVGRAKGMNDIRNIPGPDFMLSALERFSSRKHFFYGSTPVVLERMIGALRGRVPGINICGVCSPPFRQLSDEELDRHCDEIRRAGAEFIWVGLGAPRQEQWMSTVWRRLDPAILLGVGAAFDFHAGTVRRAPTVLRRYGLEWAYRLGQEPKRLWRRYLVTNSLFVWYCARDAVAGHSDSHR